MQDILKIVKGSGAMKTGKKKILTDVAIAVKKTSTLFANASCIWWDYDPKKPEAVKKLRKF